MCFHSIPGIPAPRVTWSRDGRLIDESFTTHATNGTTVRNELTVRTLDRSFLHSSFICTASNTNLTRPSSREVRVDMNFSPAHVLIENKLEPLVAGRPSEIICQTSGSRPPAHVTWYLDDQRIEGGAVSESVSGKLDHLYLLTVLYYVKDWIKKVKVRSGHK